MQYADCTDYQASDTYKHCIRPIPKTKTSIKQSSQIDIRHATWKLSDANYVM